MDLIVEVIATFFHYWADIGEKKSFAIPYVFSLGLMDRWQC